MGSFLDKPKTEKTNDSGHGNELRYGLGAMQGWRIEMEDSHCSVIGLPKSGFEQWSFFAVFDGHAGGTVSKFSARELLNSILEADPELFNELSAIYQNNTNGQSSPSASSSNLAKTNSSPNAGNNSFSKIFSFTRNKCLLFFIQTSSKCFNQITHMIFLSLDFFLI
jgi:serine/threonine protein phosphatase PrpC